VDYPIKTLSQLKPILQGFRKAAALTQAAMASRLGVTQQTYAQLEANPATVSVERLFKVLRVLQVNLTLIPTADTPSESDGVGENAAPSPAASLPAENAAASRSAKKTSTVADGSVKRKAPSSSRKQETSSATKARTTPPAKQTARKTTVTRKARNATAESKPSRAATKSGGAGKKREDW
jgi:HTH-type transcriptional regulator/antitoxin HipB